MAPLARIVPKNWRLKLAAIGLALFLWTLVRTEPVTGVNLFTVPVRAQLDDVDWVLTADPDPATVQVRLRGPPEDLIQLARTGTIVRIPFDSVTSEDTLVQLRRDWVVLEAGGGLVVEDIAPAAVRLTLQPSVSALLPLRVFMTGRLGGGVALAAPVSLDPQAVRVRGPAHRVRGLDSVRLEALDLGNVRSSGSYPVAVDTTGLAGLSLTPLMATIGLRLEAVTERVLAEVPVVIESPDTSDGAGPFSVTPATIEVRIVGARTPVTGTRGEEVRAVVEGEALAGLGPSETRMVPIRLSGVPPLVDAFAGTDSVLVGRALQ